jgi:hypothetical protein
MEVRKLSYQGHSRDPLVCSFEPTPPDGFVALARRRAGRSCWYSGKSAQIVAASWLNAAASRVRAGWSTEDLVVSRAQVLHEGVACGEYPQAGHGLDPACGAAIASAGRGRPRPGCSRGARRGARRPAALGLLAAQAPASAGTPANLRSGAEDEDASGGGAQASGMGGTPPTGDPGEAEQTCPGVQQGRSSVRALHLGTTGRPAPRCVGRRRTGWSRSLSHSGLLR